MGASTIPDVIDGRYVIGDLLGVGGMGRVYVAQDAKTDRRVAVKVLQPSLVNDPTIAGRFDDEAHAAECVSHRNVVRVLDHGATADGGGYLVMDYVGGTPLGTLIDRDGALPLLRIRSIASQILAGVAAIHCAGLVHGDIKSDNILVETSNGEDRVTVIDLGLAHPEPTHQQIGDHLVSGTPEYMAPEVIRGEATTVAADLYAVGVILYEMLTGTTPFEGGSMSMIFERHLADEVVPPSLRCPERTIPPVFEHVILRALEKDPSARHLNAEMFATALERSLPSTCADHSTARTLSSRERTRDRLRPTTRQPSRPHAEGTMPRDSEAVLRRREDLRSALAGADKDAAVTAYLDLAYALIEDHRMVVAARELEVAIALLSGSAAPSVWRLELSLAAIYDGLGDHPRARRVAIDANAHAIAVHSSVGCSRASALLRRLGVASVGRGHHSPGAA